jgi:TRAP-type C4-dicarboxylate transport system permease small subunit
MRLYNRAMGGIGGAVIGAMMLLIVAEVLSRFLTGRSIEGVIEIVGVFLALAVFFGFSPCEEIKHHVRVELVVRLLPKKLSFALDILAYSLAIIVVLTTTWEVTLEALSSWHIREVLPGVAFHVPVYPAKAACSLGYVAFFVQLVLNFLGRLGLGKRADHGP